MAKRNKKIKTEQKEKVNQKEAQEQKDVQLENENQSKEENTESQKEIETEACEDDKTLLGKQIIELKDKHLRLFSEFENFRKRTTKERIELFKTAHQDLILDLLPVIDDFDRAMKSFEDSSDAEAIKEGVALIYNKFKTTLEKKGLKCMESEGKAFDTGYHEAITEIPAPSDDLKSKVVDVVEKGYTLNEKVIRYAKVVVGK